MVLPSKASEKKALLTKENRRMTFQYLLLGTGIRSFLSFFQTSVQGLGDWTYQTRRDQGTIEMMKKEYHRIKRDIDEQYMNYIQHPTTFDIAQIHMVGSSPDNNDELHRIRKRKNSIDYVEAVHRNSQHSPKGTAKQYETILKTIYTKSLKKTRKFADEFEARKELFLTEYAEAQKKFHEQDFIVAYDEMRQAQKSAKVALWYLTQQKEEQMAVNSMSECTSSGEGYSSSKENSDTDSLTGRERPDTL